MRAASCVTFQNHNRGNAEHGPVQTVHTQQLPEQISAKNAAVESYDELSRQNIMYNFAVNVCQPKLATLISISQTRVIDATKM